jgi:hypothetical protein
MKNYLPAAAFLSFLLALTSVVLAQDSEHGPPIQANVDAIKKISAVTKYPTNGKPAFYVGRYGTGKQRKTCMVEVNEEFGGAEGAKTISFSARDYGPRKSSWVSFDLADRDLNVDVFHATYKVKTLKALGEDGVLAQVDSWHDYDGEQEEYSKTFKYAVDNGKPGLIIQAKLKDTEGDPAKPFVSVEQVSCFDLVPYDKTNPMHRLVGLYWSFNIDRYLPRTKWVGKDPSGNPCKLTSANKTSFDGWTSIAMQSPKSYKTINAAFGAWSSDAGFTSEVVSATPDVKRGIFTYKSPSGSETRIIAKSLNANAGLDKDRLSVEIQRDGKSYSCLDMEQNNN